MMHVHLWRVALDRPARHDWLSGEERDRAAGFMRPADAQHFAACRSALRGILGQRIGMCPAAVPIMQPAGHRPESIPHVPFSVSHSGNRALVAVAASGIVGADLEQVSTRPRDWLASQLSPAERARGIEDPLSLWVAKEAALKATGYGLALDAAQVVVPVGRARCRILLTQPKPRFWHLSTFAPWPDFVAALVTDRAHEAAFHDWVN